MFSTWRLTRTGSRYSAWNLLIVATMLAVIWALDHFTAPLIDMSVLYFLPIAYAAWSAGRCIAVITAVVADVPAYFDQALLLRTHLELPAVAAINMAMRLVVYLFVAEVTFRLSRDSDMLQEDLGRLNTMNTELQSAQKELHAAHSHLEGDLRAARTLQESVLEFLPPTVPGCEVGALVRYAGPIGGDYADAGMRDGRVYVCVADISGKGIPAALFTALLEHLVKDAVERDLTPTAIVAEINSVICQRFPPERFVTLFYAEIEPATGVIEYVNAGHPEGLIYRAGTSQVELAGPTSSLLGVCELSAGVQSATSYLEQGDVLTIFTDGAIEAKTKTGEQLGDEPVREMVKQYARLGAQEMAAGIASAIESITVPESMDDLTIVCIKRTDVPSV